MPDTGHAYGFDQALIWLRGGRKITRRGWNGKGMYIYLVKEASLTVGDVEGTEPLIPFLGEGARIDYEARIDMHYANGKYGVYTPTIDDILATDWNLLV